MAIAATDSASAGTITVERLENNERASYRGSEDPCSDYCRHPSGRRSFACSAGVSLLPRKFLCRYSHRTVPTGLRRGGHSCPCGAHRPTVVGSAKLVGVYRNAGLLTRG